MTIKVLDERSLKLNVQVSHSLIWNKRFVFLFEHKLRERASAKTLELELIHRRTADESLLQELSTCSTYCDDFMTTIAHFKETQF